MRTAFTATIAAFLLVSAGPAAADDGAYDECLQTMLDLKAYLRVMQSCSDAYWDRGDPGEADVLCSAAQAMHDKWKAALERQISFGKGPPSPARACPRENVLPLMGLFLKSLKWNIAYIEGRQSKFNPLPAPLKLIRFEDAQ